MTVLVVIVLTVALFKSSLLRFAFKLVLSPQIQNLIQDESIKTCKHATLKTIDKTPEFSKYDCNFSAYPGIVISELDRSSCKRISK